MKKLRTLTAPVAVAAIAAVLTVLSASSAKAQYFFQGATSSDPTVGSNYYGGVAPTFPVTTTSDLLLQSSVGGHGINYSAAQGTSTFGDLIGGEYAADAGAVANQFSGGIVNFTGATDNILGYSYASNVTVDGGTVNFLGTASGGEGTGANNSLTLGLTGAGTLSLTSGLVTTTNDLMFSYYGGGAGVLNVSGGTFDVLGTGGTLLDGASSAGTGTLNFKAGSGVFEEAASAIFSSGIKVNFATGATDLDKFEVFSTGDGTFSALAAAGSLSYGALTLDNVITDSNYYLKYLTEVQNAGVETLEVTPAATPEPSTWALMLGGLGALVLIQRRRSFNS